VSRDQEKENLPLNISPIGFDIDLYLESLIMVDKMINTNESIWAID
jgi:hypothetical protein